MYGEQIRRGRLRLGLTQQELAARFGLTSVAVGKWERGQSEPDIDTLAELADLFGMSLDELCGHQMPAASRENMSVMARAFGRLTPEEQEKYLAVGRALFAHAFGGEDEP